MGANAVVSLYIEYVLMDNMAMNYIILTLSDRLVSGNSNILRKLLSSFLGAVYSALSVLPGFSLLNGILFKLLLSFFMVIIGIGEKSTRRILVKTGAFYAVSFLLGGAMLG